MSSDWSFEKAVEVCRNERLPAVLVDLDAFDRNVRSMASLVRPSGKTIRIATKSVRVPHLLRRILDSDPVYKGLICYSAAEIRFLADQGFDDFSLAYPTVQAADLADLRAVHESGKLVRAIVDGPENLAALAAAMKGVRSPFRVLVDVDASIRLFGMHIGVQRSPIRSLKDLAGLMEKFAGHQDLQFDGLMVYEAQVAGLADRNPFRRWMSPIYGYIRRRSVAKVAQFRAELAAFCKTRGWNIEVFNGAGTGSVSYALNEKVLTELSVGSGFLSPHMFDYYSNLHTEPAFYFALPVIRRPQPGVVTCLGGGYVASGEPGWDRVPKPVYPPGAKLIKEEAAGEVQTPVSFAAGGAPEIGGSVFFRHAKGGEMAERFQEYLLLSGGRVVSRVKTYRGEGVAFF